MSLRLMCKQPVAPKTPIKAIKPEKETVTPEKPEQPPVDVLAKAVLSSINIDHARKFRGFLYKKNEKKNQPLIEEIKTKLGDYKDPTRSRIQRALYTADEWSQWSISGAEQKDTEHFQRLLALNRS